MPMMFEEARKSYGIAEAKATADLAAVDPAEVAASRGVSFDSERSEFAVTMLGRRYAVSFPSGEVRDEHERRISGAVAVLVLHYLVYRGEPLRAQGWLAYRDMPGGRDFSRAFEGMSEHKIAARFGDEPERFAEAARALEGEPGEVGDYSFAVSAFPRLPLLVVLWPADEGLPGSARILFPPQAPCYLHTEDLAALGEALADRLTGLAARGEGAGPGV